MTPCSTMGQRWSRATECIRLCKLLGHPCALCQVIGCMRSSDRLVACDPYVAVSLPSNRRPCTSPRRHQCRAGTTRPGRDQSPARWRCTGFEVFTGPLSYDPFSVDPWYWSVMQQRFVYGG